MHGGRPNCPWDPCKVAGWLCLLLLIANWKGLHIRFGANYPDTEMVSYTQVYDLSLSFTLSSPQGKKRLKCRSSTAKNIFSVTCFM